MQPKACENHGFNQFTILKNVYESGLLNKVKLTPTTKLVLIALVNHYNPNKPDMYPSMDYMVKHLGISIKSVQRAIKELGERGLVIYDTKRVNHYKFTPLFFSQVRLSNQPSQIVQKDMDKLTTKHEKEHEKNKSSFKNSYKKSWEPPNPAKSAQTTREETRKTFEQERKSPMDDRETATIWINSLTEKQLQFEPIEKQARKVCMKWNIKMPKFD